MKNINKKHFLLCIAPVLCISMLFLIPFLTDKMGKTAGYVTGFCVYWFVFCMPATLYASGNFNGLKELYRQKSSISTAVRKINYILAFLPCLATFFVVFKGTAPKAGFGVIFIALIFGLINGTIEEVFWRETFNKVFNNNVYLSYIYPYVFFGIWHISLYFAKGMAYQGGFLSLVGGTFFMGILWGWIAYKTKSIKVVTLAHIITNFFAFTGLIFENWFI
ncbi:CPBP family intramembrane metalloprotease [Clostridium sp. MSJ-4]|uniref:CPBP family intramembrane metalloprotease n=1 Tax=Clostridium simiarum TaxID=2841506 RepID=A0ABS6F467_9CLOT|nr:CPBP family intramembrane glutamic endopeptidase [Clostridium simiarum]MBU5593307.1 CPBP family intramembrane metalloprotease [Clostridium simiarum]